MSEWLKEHAWKACVGETLPRVRIPLSPPPSNAFRVKHMQSQLMLLSNRVNDSGLRSPLPRIGLARGSRDVASGFNSANAIFNSQELLDSCAADRKNRQNVAAVRAQNAEPEQSASAEDGSSG